MTMARSQPFCGAKESFSGFFGWIRVFPRIFTEKNIALRLFNNHFCVIWTPQVVSFKQAVEELDRNFEINDKYITGEFVNSHFKYDFIPKKLILIWAIFLYMILKLVIQLEQDYKV